MNVDRYIFSLMRSYWLNFDMKMSLGYISSIFLIFTTELSLLKRRMSIWSRYEMIFIIEGFLTIVFIFFFSTTFRPICLPDFFRCLSHSGTYAELRTTSFIESTVISCFDSVSHNRVQVLSIPVLLVRIEPVTSS